MADDENPSVAGTLQSAGKRHVVIVGAGFAGVNVARHLEKRLDSAWEIYLLNEQNYLTYKPLLPEVVGASIQPSNAVAPLRQMTKRTRLRMVRVQHVDPNAKLVHYQGRSAGFLKYDHLVVACGQRPRVDVIDGMDSFGLPLDTIGDALHLRNRILARLEQATIEPDRAVRDWLTTFVIVGGGFSGVEVAGELLDFLRAAVRYYKNVRMADCRVIVLHRGERLLPELPISLSRVTQASFAKRGIEVHLNVTVNKVSQDGVSLARGGFVAGGTIIVASGKQPQPLTLSLSLPMKGGRLITDADLSIEGTDGIWAAGDCAFVPNAFDGRECPPTAQFAEQQARVLADNITARIAGRQTRPFRYRPRGQLASIGHTKGVAQLTGLRVTGLVAWLMWRAFFLVRFPTLARKVRLYLEWTWAMFFPPDIAHMNFNRSKESGAERDCHESISN